MKRIFTLSLALSALSVCSKAEAQHSLQHPDSVLLSSSMEGSDEVRRYRVTKPMEADYALHYAISSAALNQSMGANPAELADLSTLMHQLADTLHSVEQIHITGYASPDGPEQLNASLAKQRAQNFEHYADKQFGIAGKYDVVLNSVIAPWSDVRAKLAASNVAGRDEALKILDGNHTPAEKQTALKALPAVWHFLAHEVLPPLRRVEVDVRYKQGEVVTTRVAMAPKPTPTPKPAPTPAPQATPKPVVTAQQPHQADPCCEELLTSKTLGIIVAMPGSEVDY